MDKTIDIYVNGSYLRKNHNRAGIQGEGNVTIMHIIFDESWAELAKKVTFWDSRGENPVERTLTADLLVDISNSLLEYNVPIPAEPLVHEGYMTFIIDGYAGGKRKRSVQDTLMVDAAMIANDASEPVDPTPTQAEQLQEQMEELLPIIQEDKLAAEQAAERAADMAEEAAIVIENGSRLINVAVGNAQSHANKAKGYAEQVEAKLDEAIAEANDIVNTTAEIANRAANSAIEANKSAEEAKASAESIAIDEAYMEGVVNEATGKVNEAKGYAEQAKLYSEMAKENIEGDFVTNTEFEEAIKNLKDVETTSDKVILSDAAADSLNFSEEKTMDDALEVIAGALNELYENMENPDFDPDDYLPRDGSKAMNGMLKFENGTGIIAVDYKQLFLAVMDDVFASGYGSRMLTLFNAKYGKSNVADALVLTDMADDGSATEYKIYGEHNKDLLIQTILPLIGAVPASVE